MRLSLMINQRHISGRFEDFRSGHALYILDQTYCYKNQRFLQSRRISYSRLRLTILETTVKGLVHSYLPPKPTSLPSSKFSTLIRDRPSHHARPPTVNAGQSHVSILHFNTQARALFSQTVQQQHPTLLIPPRLCPPFARPPQPLPSPCSPSACTFLATYSSPSPRPYQTSPARSSSPL
jgi:hypothetical protein